ncbi:MAG: aspartate 1-decarboxylase [Vampirovibrionales bacterium]|nr:aspartate 1-decarboxylase [Vampirovibrionales bacterium]
MLTVIRAKLHGITVTQADVAYHGSITLDPDFCDAVGMYPLEFVEIWNRTNGERFSTYVILGEPGSRCCIVNGAAARKVTVGDTLIIAAKTTLNAPEALYQHQARVLTFDAQNQPLEQFRYQVYATPERAFNFRMIDEATGAVMPVPLKATSDTHLGRSSEALDLALLA